MYKVVVALGALYILLKVARRFLRPLFSPIHQLPGPPSPSLVFGHMKEMFGNDFASTQERWLQEYGPAVRFTGMLNLDRVLTLDTRALHHVLTSPIYERPADARAHLRRIIGPGVLVVEGKCLTGLCRTFADMNVGPEHRKQRRIMTTAFAPGHIREVTEIFLTKLHNSGIRGCPKSVTRPSHMRFASMRFPGLGSSRRDRHGGVWLRL